MPELPEVETIKRKLTDKALGKTITEIKIENSKVIAYPDVEEFCSNLLNRKIEQISRKGKYIVFNLDSDLKLVAHMRMTGRLYAVDDTIPFEKHTHMILKLNDGLSLRFVDPRRFGRFWLAPSNEIEHIAGIEKLGLDPLYEKISPDYLKEHLGKRKKAIKILLLDQDVVAGIGNIYADEILHQAKIYPAKKGSELTDKDFNNLSETISTVIKLNLNECESKADDQLLSLLNYQNSSTIVTYKHENKPCPECGHELVRIKINGRGTCYCPHCQKQE